VPLDARVHDSPPKEHAIDGLQEALQVKLLDGVVVRSSVRGRWMREVGSSCC
jgi:hypothetical protein